ncbi:hypothetical protein K9M74_04660 [Candidatus Woesearchaeota archaeon]|nr:hypothetical protein [Candidatus Woesearchaeota archaeon]
MAIVRITESLFRQLQKGFPVSQANIILDALITLENNPLKGKSIGQVSGILIKEVKYGKYRFYCITDGHTLKFGTEEELGSLLIKFVRMSEKKDQQKVINEIKKILQSLGFEGF